MERSKGVCVVFLCVLALAFLISACGFDAYTLNGFKLYRRDTGIVVLVDNRVSYRPEVISGNIEKVSLEGDYIIGFANSITEVDGVVTPGGYFVFNTRTEQGVEGMKLSELKIFINKHLGIGQLPNLKPVRL